MRPGSPERHAHMYVRYGTTSLVAALDLQAGGVIDACRRKHRHQEFIRFLNSVDGVVRETAEPGVAVHIVMDNYATHKTPAVKGWFARRPRYHVHFTATGASRLNQVERFFSEITTRRIRRGVCRSIWAFEKAIRDFIDARNEDAKPFAWIADADNTPCVGSRTSVWILQTRDTSRDHRDRSIRWIAADWAGDSGWGHCSIYAFRCTKSQRVALIV